MDRDIMHEFAELDNILNNKLVDAIGCLSSKEIISIGEQLLGQNDITLQLYKEMFEKHKDILKL